MPKLQLLLLVWTVYYIEIDISVNYSDIMKSIRVEPHVKCQVCFVLFVIIAIKYIRK
jgi:hypothetical protein